jgi:hypothetical protein
VIKTGHTVYLDPTVDWYSDFLFIGSHAGSGATDDSDQIQAIGCAGKFSIGGLAAGETPFVEFEFFVGDWQWVNYADQASFSHTTAWVGANPIYSAAEGQLMIQDLATTTRNAIKGGDIEIDFGFYDLVPVTDYNSPNNIGGWKRVRTDQGPRITIKAYWTALADMPGLYADVLAGTGKQVLFQVGNTTQATMAIYMQRSFIQGLDPSNRVEYEKNTALQLTFEGANGTATLLADAHDKLQDTAFALCLL